ncbi:ACT domain-containing protein [Shewanella glacialipiscicola]|uniref:Amino acid-binding protein n=1 Tax=Shewanella glacialipiscicola TaxID=614069 RepID=A0ABQ6J1H1_9GAMM|nr:ACT domain-containing protein [Shewanella glacialipiscicola]MCL1085921.1 ACT domain-containing protein [Shewanella glacialipiscicola]GIU14241.1 amino acid-binding protein [Shewanella glacialipiscicola]GMA81971.1 amino acid-binding protein [Shewanella glacialipiscicola]
MRMTLAVLPEQYTIHSFSPNAVLPSEVFAQEIYFIGKTPEGLSLVIDSDVTLDSLEQEHGWRCFEVLGPLGFLTTGILSKVLSTLADEHISIFAMSTFDTDYILVKYNRLSLAIDALRKQGYHIIESKSEV